MKERKKKEIIKEKIKEDKNDLIKFQKMKDDHEPLPESLRILILEAENEEGFKKLNSLEAKLPRSTIARLLGTSEAFDDSGRRRINWDDFTKKRGNKRRRIKGNRTARKEYISEIKEALIKNPDIWAETAAERKEKLSEVEDNIKQLSTERINIRQSGQQPEYRALVDERITTLKKIKDILEDSIIELEGRIISGKRSQKKRKDKKKKGSKSSRNKKTRKKCASKKKKYKKCVQKKGKSKCKRLHKKVRKTCKRKKNKSLIERVTDLFV